MSVDVTINSQYITGETRGSEPVTSLINEINQIIQTQLVDTAEAIEAKTSILSASLVWLDLIGKKMNLDRPGEVVDEENVFGFDGHGVGFDQAIFWPGIDELVPVTDEVYRRYLIARGLQLLTDCTIESMEAIVAKALDHTELKYIDSGGMGLALLWDGCSEKHVFIDMFLSTGLITKPAGVRIDELYLPQADGCFGFDGHGLGFDQAPFCEIINL